MNRKRKRKLGGDEEHVNGEISINGESNISAVSLEPSAKKPTTITKADLYRPPTNEELQQLRETEYLFHSSLFRLQLTELLKEVYLSEKKFSSLAVYVASLQKTILKLSADHAEYQLKDSSLKLSGIALPIQCELKRMKGTFRFSPPTSVKLIGSHSAHLSIKPDVSIDLCLEIPKICIHPKDYLNQRFLLKRTLYLMTVARQLKQHSDLLETLSFTYHRNNHMMPIIVLKPKGEGLGHVCVRLHTSIPDSVFKLHRFHVQRNNIRAKWFNSVEETDEQGDADSEDVPTPLYNSLHLEDILRCQHAEKVNETLKDAQEVRDGITLLKVWLRQRELDQGYGAFSGFIMTMFVIYLLKKKKLSFTMSSYQILRNTLLHLSQSLLETEGITLAETLAATTTDSARPSLADFHAAFDVVFVDFSGYMNICSQMNVGIYRMVKHEATLALSMLESSEVDNFELLLVKPVPFLRRFDQLIHIDHLENLQLCAVKQNLDNRVVDHNENYVNLCLPAILDVLHNALKQRVHLVGVYLQKSSEWDIAESPPSVTGPLLTLGLLLNEEHCYSVIERGPAADSPEAKSFRDFWGDASEMRRFQDGSICEAVVWKSKTLAERRTITGRIAKHILEMQAAIPRSTITFVCGQLETLIKLPQPSKKKFALQYGTGEEQHLSCVSTFDEFSRQLRNLQDLPLALNTVQGVAPVFRYAEVFPPLNARIISAQCEDKPTLQNHQWLPSLKVLCFPEISGSWPDDWQALRRTKAAYYLQLANLIRTQLKLSCLAYSDHLLVHKAGYTFHLEVAYPKEIGAMRTVMTEDGLSKQVDSEAARELETNIVHLPKLSTHLHGVQQSHISFGAAVRLAKRWLSAHMLLDGHFSAEAVELLTAHVYLSPAPFSSPSTPQVGFVRFLHLLISHDWQTSPVIVNFNNELQKDDITDIQQQFTRDRSTLPLLCIVTPMDHIGGMWTHRKPQPIIMQRVVVLARESLKIVEAQLMDNSIDTDFRQIFRPSLEAFDVIIHLNVHKVKRYYEAVDLSDGMTKPKFNTEPISEDEARLTLCFAEFDCVQEYIKELRATFDDVALFFYDVYGGDKISVLWKPAAARSYPFKVSHMNFSMVQAESVRGKDVELMFNKEAVLEDFRIMGAGLVSNVEIIVKR